MSGFDYLGYDGKGAVNPVPLSDLKKALLIDPEEIKAIQAKHQLGTGAPVSRAGDKYQATPTPDIFKTPSYLGAKPMPAQAPPPTAPIVSEVRGDVTPPPEVTKADAHQGMQYQRPSIEFTKPSKPKALTATKGGQISDVDYSKILGSIEGRQSPVTTDVGKYIGDPESHALLGGLSKIGEILSTASGYDPAAKASAAASDYVQGTIMDDMINALAEGRITQMPKGLSPENQRNIRQMVAETQQRADLFEREKQADKLQAQLAEKGSQERVETQRAQLGESAASRQMQADIANLESQRFFGQQLGEVERAQANIDATLRGQDLDFLGKMTGGTAVPITQPSATDFTKIYDQLKMQSMQMFPDDEQRQSLWISQQWEPYRQRMEQLGTQGLPTKTVSGGMDTELIKAILSGGK